MKSKIFKWMNGSRRCEFKTTNSFIMTASWEVRSSAQAYSLGLKMQNNRTKLSTHFFMANREPGACRGVAFNLFVCFGPVLIKGFSELLPSPSQTFQTPLCFSPLSFYLFNLWKEPKGVPNVPSPRRAGFPTGLQMPGRKHSNRRWWDEASVINHSAR